MSLEKFLTSRADEIAPLDDMWPDCREYAENENTDALTDEWVKSGTTYIWKTGVLAQWDSNKCDHVKLFIGHERSPGHMQFIGVLCWSGGENDDIGRSLASYCDAATRLHPVFFPD